jgi:cysteine-rich CWC protein
MELRPERCEACGKTFGCGAQTGGCWCDDVPMDPAALAALRARYERCLCPDCLLAAREGENPAA